MKTILIPLFALLLLPASYPIQKPSEVVENGRLPHEESIQHQTREPAETVLYFPDYVDGGGWSVQLALSNVDPETAADVAVEIYGVDGASVTDLFEPGTTFEIPPLGSRVMRSSGTGAIRRGWIQVRTGTDSVSGLLTYKEGTTGIEVSVEPAELGGRFALFVEESDDVGAGVAVFKPEAAPSVQLRVRDEEGNDPLEGAFVSRGEFSPVGAHAAGMVRRGGDRPGIPERFPGSAVPADRGRIELRSAGAAVRKEEPIAFVGSGHPG